MNAMTPEEREAFYDTHIAPALLVLAERCKKNELNFLAIVEWGPGEHGRTINLSQLSGLGIRWADTAARANGNADSLIMALMRQATETGHSSACLHRLGVPLKPPATDGT